jgi:lipopolysaccharide transport system permease protein
MTDATVIPDAPAAPVPDVVEPELRIIERGRASLRQYFRDLRNHRDLVRVLAARDLKLRYRQTALGVVWVLLQPILAAGVLSFVFGRIAKLPSDGVSSYVFTFAGMQVWTVINGTISRTTGAFLSNASLVSKVYFPRLILPLSALASVAVDFGVSVVLLIGLLYSSHLAPGLPFLLLPLWFLLAVVLAQALGLFLASLSVHYRDVGQITPVVLGLMLYASPIAYSASAVPKRYFVLYHLNPFAGIIEGARWALVGTPLPPTWTIVYASVLAVVLYLGAVVMLERLEHRFADVI